MMSRNTIPVGSAAGAIAQQLRASGERVTQGRLAVLDVLATATDVGEHLSADEIAHRATEAAPGLHRATVYRALTALGELGMLTHTHLPGAATVYHLTSAGPPGIGEADRDETGRGETNGLDPHGSHAHLQCVNCGTVLDIPLDVLAPVASRLERDLDFVLDPTHTALLGTCATCAATATRT